MLEPVFIFLFTLIGWFYTLYFWMKGEYFIPLIYAVGFFYVFKRITDIDREKKG